MIKLNLLFVICLVQIVYGREKLKCSLHQFPSSCPDNAICEQMPSNDTNINVVGGDGECNCPKDKEFNPNFKDEGQSLYCIAIKNYSNNRNRDDHPINSNDHSAAEKLATTTTTTKQRAPSSHHIISGILISILIVTAFILTVIAVKKLRIRQRFREFGISQRNRPLYEDVMMGNDIDDPPLI